MVWIVLIAISIPKSMQALRNASASIATKNTAVATIRSLNTAEIAYAQAHPATGYTCSLPDLRKAWGVNEKLVEGYVFTVRGCKAIKPNGPIEKYELVAAPQAQKNGPTYCSSESDEIKVAARGAEQDCWKSGVALSETRVNREE